MTSSWVFARVKEERTNYFFWTLDLGGSWTFLEFRTAICKPLTARLWYSASAGEDQMLQLRLMMHIVDAWQPSYCTDLDDIATCFVCDADVLTDAMMFGK